VREEVDLETRGGGEPGGQLEQVPLPALRGVKLGKKEEKNDINRREVVRGVIGEVKTIRIST